MDNLAAYANEGAFRKLGEKPAVVKSNVLELQQNSCANCGLNFSDEDVPTFRYLIPPTQGGEESDDNVEALCKRCFGESGSEAADQ